MAKCRVLPHYASWMSLPREPAPNLPRRSPYLDKPEKNSHSRMALELITKNQQLAEAREQNAANERKRVNVEQQLRAANEQLDLKIQERTSEIRTLSYLLHPPMLDEAGLASAVEWYARGFSDRSKIAVDLDIDSALPRFPTEVETAIFRIVQESLVNIHRHSGSRTAYISLR